MKQVTSFELPDWSCMSNWDYALQVCSGTGFWDQQKVAELCSDSKKYKVQNFC